MRALSSPQAPPKPRSPASKCAALRRGSGQLQRHCDCGGIKSAAGLQACQMRFCSPILMHHDADGKELGGFWAFQMRIFVVKWTIGEFAIFPHNLFSRCGDFASADATKGLCDRPLETFACTPMLVVCTAACGYGGQCG